MVDTNILGLCLTFFAAIFAITNPLGALPIFISLTANLYPKDRNRVNIITSISITIIVLISMLLGTYILHFFGVTLNAFRLAGGLMICSLAWPMLSGNLSSQKQNKEEKNEIQETQVESTAGFQPSSIAIVPMAMPLMAGPGTISTAILWANKVTNLWVFLALALTMCIYSLMIYILFALSPIITRLLGSTGINIITRLMGLFMMALGVQFIITAVSEVTIALVPLLTHH